MIETTPEYDENTPLESLSPRVVAWGAWLHRAGLDGLASALLDALDPLAPLGAQVLYIAQPTLSLFGSRQAAGDLAHILETPGGIDWLRHTMELDD
jgi:hypothetical protein